MRKLDEKIRAVQIEDRREIVKQLANGAIPKSELEGDYGQIILEHKHLPLLEDAGVIVDHGEMIVPGEAYDAAFKMVEDLESTVASR